MRQVNHGPELRNLPIRAIPVESKTILDKFARWGLTKIRAKMMANEVAMHGSEVAFSDGVEAGLEPVVGEGGEDGFEDVLRQLLDILGESDADRAVELDVELHEVEERLGGDFVIVPCMHETRNDSLCLLGDEWILKPRERSIESESIVAHGRIQHELGQRQIGLLHRQHPNLGLGLIHHQQHVKDDPIILQFIVVAFLHAMISIKSPEDGSGVVRRNSSASAGPVCVDVEIGGGEISSAHVTKGAEGGRGKGVAEGIMLAIQPAGNRGTVSVADGTIPDHVFIPVLLHVFDGFIGVKGRSDHVTHFRIDGFARRRFGARQAPPLRTGPCHGTNRFAYQSREDKCEAQGLLHLDSV